MPNINKVVFGNQTLIDLSTTTLSAASQLQNGITAYDRAGNVITGTASGGGSDSGGIIYEDLDGYIHLSEEAANVISIVDTLDTAGGTIRTITGAVESGGGFSADNVAAGITGAISLTGTTIRAGAFASSDGITSISAPNVTEIHSFALWHCSGVQSASFPSLTTVYFRAFNGFGTDGMSLYLPSLSSCPNGGELTGTSGSAVPFADSDFSYFVAPNYSSGTTTYFLANCANLLAVDLAQASSINTNCFNGCSKINMIVLRRSSLCSLSGTNAFTGTPFASGGTGGTLYVPQSLISSYEGATNWSTILAYTNNQIKSIESTHTDVTAPIDLTLYYADGTAIPTT